jgi:hypothetical protein
MVIDWAELKFPEAGKIAGSATPAVNATVPETLEP